MLSTVTAPGVVWDDCVVTGVSGRVVQAVRAHGFATLALAGIAVLGVVYPWVDERTQHPLAVFVLPVLIIAALGSWRETLLVAGVATLVALAEGIRGPLMAPAWLHGW